MATKSILKTVYISDRKLGHTFAQALESSKLTKGKDVELTRECRDLKGDEIKSFFDTFV